MTTTTGDDAGTIRALLAKAMERERDPGPILSCTVPDADLDQVLRRTLMSEHALHEPLEFESFESRSGVARVVRLVAWTERFVYIGNDYDDGYQAQIVSAPRNPPA